MNIRNFTLLSITLITLLLTLLFATAYRSHEIQREIVEKEHRRFNSMQWAKELLQSSDDLTRMARSYVVTGNSVYKEYFFQVLAIRNGKAPRPKGDTSTYWHLEGIGKEPITEMGEAIPLFDLIRWEGLTDRELELLFESQKNSDRLTELERRAFAAMEGRLDAGSDDHSIEGEPDKELAQVLLWGEEYINEKAKIMRPLKQFVSMMNTRTQEELTHAQEQLSRLIIQEIIILFVLLSNIVMVLLYIGRYIVLPMRSFAEETKLIAAGQYSVRNRTAGTHELAKLGIDFNHMATAIEQVVTQLEQVVMQLEQAKNSLQQSEARLIEAQHIAQIGSWEIDLTNNAMHWSDEVFHILETDRKNIDVSFEIFLNHIHPEDREKVYQTYLNSLVTRTANEIEHRLIMPDGRIKWVNERYETYCDDQGSPLRSLGTVQDISEHKESEETIGLYASVFEHSGESIVITDAKGSVVAANAAFCKLMRYSHDEALRKTLRELAFARESEEGFRTVLQTLSETNFWQGEIGNLLERDRSVVIWLSISAIRNNQNQIINYVASFSDITDYRAAMDKIHYLAHHDTLTNLPNRFTLIERFRQAVNSAKRNNEMIALMFIDLDRFKEINDTLGHHVGDSLLVEVAQRLKGCVRNNDIVARLGGDEFVVAMLELQVVDSVFYIADKILYHLRRSYVLDGYEIHSSPSIGIAFFPTDGDSVEEVMKNADVAMYHAKSKGRNNYQFFEPSMNQANLERLELEHDMRVALEREEFVLYYQPKIDIETLQVIGVEALIRWQHPKKGLISPAVFIPLAEESGFMVILGEWVLRSACGQLGQWHKQGMLGLEMAVNLSQSQFRHANLSDMVVAILNEAEIKPGMLELEITESMVMENPQRTIETMLRLRDIGIKLALDDFGTGYSSLSYLKQFPINCVKLDRSYVKDIETDPYDVAICAATISLAFNLGLDVVAEGVETEKQYKYLKRLGCSKEQGYYFCKPLPADEVAEFIAVRNSKDLLQAIPACQTNVLIIDDDEWICDFYVHTLTNMGHYPIAALDPVEGMALIRSKPNFFDLIILDMLMPNMSGMDLIEEVYKVNPGVPIVVSTAFKMDAVRKTLRTLEKEYNLLYGINYFILEKPLGIEVIKDLIKKIF